MTVSERVNTQLTSQDTGRLFAVVHAAGKQRKVTVEDIIILDKHLAADIGQRIRLNKVSTRQLDSLSRDYTRYMQPFTSIPDDSGPLSQRAAIAKVCGTHAEQYAQ